MLYSHPVRDPPESSAKVTEMPAEAMALCKSPPRATVIVPVSPVELRVVLPNETVTPSIVVTVMDPLACATAGYTVMSPVRVMPSVMRVSSPPSFLIYQPVMLYPSPNVYREVKLESLYRISNRLASISPVYVLSLPLSEMLETSVRSIVMVASVIHLAYRTVSADTV